MQTTTEPKSLLVLEDDDAFRSQLARAMTRRGFQSRTASSLAEALGSIKEDAPAFFIADLRLADGSGLEAIEALHRIKPAARALVLTAYGDIPAAVAAVRLGAIDCVPKTATADEIADILLTPEGERPPAPANRAGTGRER